MTFFLLAVGSFLVFLAEDLLQGLIHVVWLFRRAVITLRILHCVEQNVQEISPVLLADTKSQVFLSTTDRQADTHTDTHRQTDRPTGRQTDTKRQKGSQPYKQTDATFRLILLSVTTHSLAIPASVR